MAASISPTTAAATNFNAFSSSSLTSTVNSLIDATTANNLAELYKQSLGLSSFTLPYFGFSSNESKPESNPYEEFSFRLDPIIKTEVEPEIQRIQIENKVATPLISSTFSPLNQSDKETKAKLVKIKKLRESCEENEQLDQPRMITSASVPRMPFDVEPSSYNNQQTVHSTKPSNGDHMSGGHGTMPSTTLHDNKLGSGMVSISKMQTNLKLSFRALYRYRAG